MPYKDPTSAAARASAQKKSRRWRATHPGAQSLAARDWEARNPEKKLFYSRKSYHKDLRRSHGHKLKGKYGLTVERYEEMVVSQAGRCAICGTDTPGGNRKKLCVDHDHKTGTIRGLLCNLCNIGLGAFKDDTDLLLRAVGYLRPPGSL